MSQNIDRILYINLAHRTDRKDHIEKVLADYGLVGERVDAVQTAGFGIYGCTLSHIKALTAALDAGYKNVLILEDDFQFLVSKEEFEEQMAAAFQVPFNVCLLQGSNVKEEPYNDMMVRVLDSMGASGYIIRRDYIPRLLELYRESANKLYSTKMHWIYANDRIWVSLQQKDLWIIFKKHTGRQLDGYSDISDSYVLRS